MERKQLDKKLKLINPKLRVKGNLIKFKDGTWAGLTIFDLNKWCYEDKTPLSDEELNKLSNLLKNYFVESLKNVK